MSFFHLRGQTTTGYAVDAKRAVDILGISHPEAAAWWRKNTPQIFAQNRQFVFQRDACQLIAAG